ncbi:MAG: EAL domain-containing protein [Prochloraceae cyanobacterium]|nr:EAL domain-containing protein [Prochloraceae cyanobacterium]
MCAGCSVNQDLKFDFTMAFQPIVNLGTQQIFAYEALVRGINNESAYQILAQVNEKNRYRFDQLCRRKAIELAAQLNLQTYLSINFLPNAVYRPELCIQSTLLAAQRLGFSTNQIIFEVTEGEKIDDRVHLKNILQEYQRLGFQTAIDDFGAGYAGLNLLAEFQPNLIKIDMQLIRDVQRNHVKQAIVQAIVHICRQLDLEVVAEGVETIQELNALKQMGITLFQGYYFAKPAFENLPTINRWRTNSGN